MPTQNRTRRSTPRPGHAFAGSVAVLLLLGSVAGCGSNGKASSSKTPTSSTASATSGASTSTARATTTTSARTATTVDSSVAGFHLPATLSRAAAMPGANGHLVVIGGLHDAERTTAAVLDIDPTAGTVTVAAPLPMPVHDTAGAPLGGIPTVFGGGNTREVAAIQQAGPGGPSTAGQMPTPVSDAVAVSTAGGVIVIGGYDGRQTLGSIFLVTSANHIVRLGTLPVPVRYAAAAVLGTGANQRVLVVGGESGGIATDAVQEIDPATGKATIVGHLPAPRTQASALVLGGQLFVFGGAASGATSAHVFSDVLRWVPGGTLVPAGTLPYPTSDAAATTLNGTVGYLVGGESPARVGTTIIVTPH